jgi:glycolate oxidase FAD binding subunit
MSATLAPASVAELVEVVRSCPRLLAVGAGTKPRLSEVTVTKVSTLGLRGIVEYEPSEFTFTAMAGTPIKDLANTLAARGQYLPFDPFLTEAGATLGGTVAAGLSGPGRARFGGLRDFILGVRYVDGLGRLLRMGGKVVKNAAGFELPKFFVGSLGRFGVLAELTFKVFPAPASTLTLKLVASDIEGAARILVEASSARWELDALDILPGSYNVLVRLAGPPQALQQIAKEILARWPGESLTEANAQCVWSELREFQWADANGPLVKVALTPAILSALYRAMQSLEGVRVHVSGAGNLALVSIPVDLPSRQDCRTSPLSPGERAGVRRSFQNSSPECVPKREGSLLTSNPVGIVNEILLRLGLSAVTLRGEAPLWCGVQPRPNIAQAVKHALDPENRFPGLDE